MGAYMSYKNTETINTSKALSNKKNILTWVFTWSKTDNNLYKYKTLEQNLLEGTKSSHYAIL